MIEKTIKERISNVEARRVGMSFWTFSELNSHISNASPWILRHTHLDKLIKADLPILVQVTCSHQVFYNFSHSVPRQRQAGSLEQIIQLIAADVPIAIRICKANGELKVWGDLGHSTKRGESRLDWRGAGRRGSHSGVVA